MKRPLRFVALLCVLGAVGCAKDKPAESPDNPKPGPMERTGNKVDKAAEDVKDATVKAAGTVKKKTESVVESVKDAG